MKREKPTYSKQVIEIADFIYKYPDKRMSDVLSYFVERCRKNRRTVERYVKEAKAYNNERIRRQEGIRNEVLQVKTKEAFFAAVLTRKESLVVLSKIAKGEGRRVLGEVFAPTDGDRIRAIQQLSKMQGWETEKVDVTTGGKEFYQSIQIEIIDKTEKVEKDVWTNTS